jgi:TolB-like protein/DNA-binding winged helix-turn-helix (wHTH) protein
MKEVANGHNKIVFGEFRLDSGSRMLWRGNEEVHLPKRPFDVLRFLIENRERVISRDEFLDKFWDGCEVYDDALRKCVGTIRKAIGDKGKPPRFIETYYGGGFRFIGSISEEKKEITNAVLVKNRPAAAEIINNTQYLIRYRKLLTATLLLGILFFGSLGFYVYSNEFYVYSNDKEGQSGNSMQTSTPVRSIAVLPLKNLTGDANNEYFSDGVTESIITELSRVSELRTVSRSSTFALKDKEIDPREAGRKLTVDALLEGSLQKKGDLMSVSVRLISTRDGSILWTSQDFERSTAYLHELQDTISCNIAAELRMTLCDTSAGQKTTNADAYRAYLKGRYHWNKRSSEGIKKSIEFYKQAINLDPGYAQAYAGLSESYVQGIWHVPFISKEILPQAEEAALKAVELDDMLAEAHTALANVYELGWNWATAESELQRAIERNPHYARAHHVQAFLYMITGRNDEAIDAIERAEELDPLNLVINTDKANLLFHANRIDEAFQQWQKTIELDPNFGMAYGHRAVAYQTLGNESAAIEDIVRAMELNGQSTDKIIAYRQTVSRYGLKETYRNELKTLLAKETRGEYVPPVSLAFFYTSLGQKEEAFKYLEKAFRERSGEMVLLPSPEFAGLRSDPRFGNLLKRMGLLREPLNSYALSLR